MRIRHYREKQTIIYTREYLSLGRSPVVSDDHGYRDGTFRTSIDVDMCPHNTCKRDGVKE